MTSVTFYKNGDTINRVTASGHAGFRRAGKDIVCASISVLVINTVNSIEKFTEDDIVVSQDEKTGLIDFSINGQVSDDSRLLINSLELGIKEIEKAYGKYVTVDYKEV